MSDSKRKELRSRLHSARQRAREGHRARVELSAAEIDELQFALDEVDAARQLRDSLAQWDQRFARARKAYESKGEKAWRESLRQIGIIDPDRKTRKASFPADAEADLYTKLVTHQGTVMFVDFLDFYAEAGAVAMAEASEAQVWGPEYPWVQALGGGPRWDCPLKPEEAVAAVQQVFRHKRWKATLDKMERLRSAKKIPKNVPFPSLRRR